MWWRGWGGEGLVVKRIARGTWGGSRELYRDVRCLRRSEHQPCIWWPARAWIAALGHMHGPWVSLLCHYTHKHCIFSFSGKFYFITFTPWLGKSGKSLQNTSESISATFSFTCAVQPPVVPLSVFCLFLMNTPTSEWSALNLSGADEAVGWGYLRGSLATLPTIFRLGLWLCHILNRLTGTGTLGLLFCSPELRFEAPVTLSPITLTRYNMRKHTLAWSAGEEVQQHSNEVSVKTLFKDNLCRIFSHHPWGLFIITTDGFWYHLFLNVGLVATYSISHAYFSSPYIRNTYHQTC